MINEPDEVKDMRDLMNTDYVGYSWEADPPSKYMILLTLFEYIDQLQGLLEGVLMIREDGSVVQRIPMCYMEIGDLWYAPITFSGPMTGDMLCEDIDDETL